MYFVKLCRFWVPSLFFVALNMFSPGALSDHEEACDWGQNRVTAYESGFRGVLPPAADEWNHQSYEVLGKRDGLKTWLIRYDDHFYRGGELESADGAHSLAKLGIKTVFAITSADKEREWLESQGIKVVNLSFDKNASLDQSQIRHIAEQLSAHPAPVYVHCVGGTQRGGVVGVIYRLTHGWKPDQSLLEFAYLGGSLKANDNTLKAVLKTLSSGVQH
ncbi:phosphatase domain-containing protein [Endozoicomonas acroporae]|uniref:phosphatase domain-containing protein n=2 Tax=Endozoicomonas acroporae TaxID=1701104 RepID=UPI000C77FE0C|nr:tyrosine-protein phosphatase [Endozoicomonas acroporae]